MTPEQIEQLIRELMRTGEILASEAFRIALQQVKVEILQNGVGFVICTIVAIFLWILFRKEDEPMLAVFALASNVISMFFLMDGLARVINPEYYAIRILLEMAGIG